jgi:hypothetical protein
MDCMKVGMDQREWKKKKRGGIACWEGSGVIV